MAKTQKAGLGRGFDGLIPTNLSVDDVANPGEVIRKLSLDKLVANPNQPRKTFDEQSLKELADSINEYGIIQPLVATPHGDKFRIVAGERRFRASQLAGLSKVPVVVRDHKELEELEVALVENVQRVDLSPIEQAVSIVRLRDQFSMTPKDIARKLGKAETTISNIVRLLQLPEEAVLALQENRISEGHARAILALKTDEKLQKELLNNIIVHKWSVRAAEQFVTNQKVGRNTNESSPKLKLETRKLLNKVDPTSLKRIKIAEKGKGGKVTISYQTLDELQKILELYK